MTIAYLFAAMLQVTAPAAAVPPPAAPTASVAPVAPPRGRTTLFIAPSGEPFRGVGGDPYPVSTWFAQADADHDGKVTRSELRADAMRYFKVLDTNGDGIVDSSEITHYEEVLVPEVQVNFDGGAQFRQSFASSGGPGEPSSGDKPTRAMPDLPRGGGRYSLINAPEPVVAADSDLNRRVSAGEMMAASERRFTLLDPDERGYLTLATLPKTPIQARAEAMIKRKK